MYYRHVYNFSFPSPPQFNINDRLPKYCCSNCISNLNAVYAFRVQCEMTQEKLFHSLAENELDEQKPTVEPRLDPYIAFVRNNLAKDADQHFVGECSLTVTHINTNNVPNMEQIETETTAVLETIEIKAELLTNQILPNDEKPFECKEAFAQRVSLLDHQ